MAPTSNQQASANPMADGDDTILGTDMRDPRTLAPGLQNDGRNLRFTDFVPQTRKGVIKPGWGNKVDALTSVVISPWGKVYGGGTFTDPDSVAWALLAADGYAWRLLPYNQPVAIPLPTGVRLLGPVTFCQAFNNVYCFRGQFLAPLRMQNFDDGFQDLVAHWSVGAATAVGTEVAYGPFQSVTSITRVGNTATATTAAPHGFQTGADVTQQGAGQAEYNVRANITVIDDVTYTFPVSGTPASPATGTITCSNMIQYWKAAGTLVTLSSLTSAATTATATKTAHGFTTGQSVTIAGASPAAYNGTYTITVTDADHFTYTFAGGTSPATGTITARNNAVSLAGSAPDTSPNDWTRVWNILPNADNALYVNNRLLVPTAYEPSSADNYATFNGGSYRKKDYLIATDYLDDLHFDFSNEFRINQGDADEIVDLAKFNENTVVVWKNNSWAVLSNVALDLTQLSLDFRNFEYGLAARGSWTLAGADLFFVATKRGVVSVRQSENGKLIGVDLPLSAPIQKLIDRVDWTLGAGIRLANWDSKLYCAVPLDNGTRSLPSRGNNTILVYDLVAAARAGGAGLFNPFGWTPRDTGTAICPVEFIKLPVDKLERLLFFGADGYVNLMEESYMGDQVANAAGAQGLGWEEIESYSLTRAYVTTYDRLSKPFEAGMVLQTWNPSYSANLIFSGVNKKTVLTSNRTRSATKYFRPFDKPAWDATNTKDDHADPDRQDYRVAIGSAGLYLGSGVELDRYQEAIHAIRLNGRQGRSFQLELTNTQGRIKLLGVGIGAMPGRQRKGLLT